MNPVSSNIQDLFVQEKRFTVPHFQRPYVWKHDDQWKPLWEDVSRIADEFLRRASGDEAPLPHFLGAVVLAPQTVQVNQIAALDIVDGQQRLTTLQVLLAAVRDLFRTEGYGDDAEDLHDLVHPRRRRVGPERFKVWPTNADRSAYEAVLTAGSREEVDAQFPIPRTRRKIKERAARLADAYITFYDAAYAYVHADDPADLPPPQPNGSEESEGESVIASAEEEQVSARRRARVVALHDALLQGLRLVVIGLDAHDDPQVIFESLNGHGEPLHPSDLLRNFVFQQVDRVQQVDRAPGQSAEDIYERYWAPFEEPFWRIEQKQGRLKRPRSDLFFFHFLTLHTERDFRVTHLFQEFKTWWKKQKGDASGGDITPLLESIRSTGAVFQDILLVNEGREVPFSPRTQAFLERLRVLDLTTVYPLILGLLSVRRDLTTVERDRAFEVLESYLIRRMVCRLDTKNYNRLFVELLPKAKHTPSPAQAITEHLLNTGGGDSVRWPDDDEFRKAWLANPLYQFGRDGRVRMLLLALEAAHSTHFQEHVELTPSFLTVEHVLPQAYYPHYPIEEPSWEKTIRREQMLHTIGNLTLLTHRLNSSVSNGPFTEKAVAIAGQSKLALNVYFQGHGESAAWAEEDILARGEALFAYAHTIWPRP